jgi:hypothetical protein
MRPLMNARTLGSFVSFLLFAVGAFAQALPPELRVYDGETANPGWPSQLVNLNVPLNQSYVLIFLKTPSVTLDLMSVESLQRSVVEAFRNERTSLDLGHAVLAWQCRRPNGFHRGATAMTGEQSGQADKMLRDGWGLAALSTVFKDGYLESIENLQVKTIPRLTQSGPLGGTLIPVSDSACERLTRFVLDFARNPTASSNFGFNLRPDNFEGAGCLSFVAAALKVSGMFPKLDQVVLSRFHFRKEVFGCPHKPNFADRVTPCWIPDWHVDKGHLWAWSWQATQYSKVPFEFVDTYKLEELLLSVGQPLQLPQSKPAE